MSEPSRRQLILEAIKGRLEAIKKSDGFQTDAGCNVFLHEAPAFGPDDPQSGIAIVVADDAVGWQGANLAIGLQVELQAFSDTSLTRCWEECEAILSDIKRAMELEDRRFGGLIKPELVRGSTRTLPREPGTTTVGVGVSYGMTYVEVWGHPED